MSKIRTLSQLSDFLDRELAWRKRELTTIKFSLDGARDHVQAIFRRAAVAMLYAHWEGFIKNSGTAYCEYVSYQGLKVRDVELNFVVLGLKKRLEQLRVIAKGRQLMEVASYIRAGAGDSLQLPVKSCVQTKSNLSAERFFDIVALLGLELAPFELKAKTIIDPLLEKRNQVAHGQVLDIDQDLFNAFYTSVVDMLDAFRTEIYSAASSGRFRAGNAGAMRSQA